MVGPSSLRLLSSAGCFPPEGHRVRPQKHRPRALLLCCSASQTFPLPDLLAPILLSLLFARSALQQDAETLSPGSVAVPPQTAQAARLWTTVPHCKKPLEDGYPSFPKATLTQKGRPGSRDLWGRERYKRGNINSSEGCALSFLCTNYAT